MKNFRFRFIDGKGNEWIYANCLIESREEMLKEIEERYSDCIVLELTEIELEEEE